MLRRRQGYTGWERRGVRLGQVVVLISQFSLGRFFGFKGLSGRAEVEGIELLLRGVGNAFKRPGTSIQCRRGLGYGRMAPGFEPTLPILWTWLEGLETHFTSLK